MKFFDDINDSMNDNIREFWFSPKFAMPFPILFGTLFEVIAVLIFYLIFGKDFLINDYVFVYFLVGIIIYYFSASYITRFNKDFKKKIKYFLYTLITLNVVLGIYYSLLLK